MSSVQETVRGIIADVRERGDQALCDDARRFDGVELAPKNLVVGAAELAQALKKISPSFLKAIKECSKQIERFAVLEKKHVMRSWMAPSGGIRVGQWVSAVDSTGLYVPGGRFPYPSTVLMTAIPARVAGVGRIVLASPAKNLTPEVLAAAAYSGCQRVYRIGGAGAIAAFAFGTKNIPKVDFIVGPGNQYVTEAKRQVYGQVGIDSLAGPSEVVIVTDGKTPAHFIETDLQAQAEHDPEARAILISTDRRVMDDVARRIAPAIKNRISFRYAPNLNAAIDAANEIGAEHLELLFRDAPRYLSRVRHAGAIFLGPSTTAVLGDYVAGPSHVLPTQRAARFSSGLSVATFLKRSSVMQFQARRTERPLWEAALTMAQTEGMENHEKSLRARMTI